MRINLTCGALLIALAAGVGCRQDMQDQPKYIPLRPSDFFGDGRSERPLIEGTVARGHLDDDDAYYTGRGPDGQFVDEFPFPVTKEVVERGQDRFNIYCAPCHDRLGNGNGKIVRRGYRHPPSYHIDRLRQVPNGYIYDVITSGFGAMPDYCRADSSAPTDGQLCPTYALSNSRITARSTMFPRISAGISTRRAVNDGGRVSISASPRNSKPISNRCARRPAQWA